MPPTAPTVPTAPLSAPPTALPTEPTVPLSAPPTVPPTAPTVPTAPLSAPPTTPPTVPTAPLSVLPTAPPTVPTVPCTAPPTASTVLPTVPSSTPPTAPPAAPTTPPTRPPTPSALFCAATVAWPASFRLRSATTSWPSGACTRTLPATPVSKAAVIARSCVSPGSSSLAGSVTAAVALTCPWPSIWCPASFSCESTLPSTDALRPDSEPADAPATAAAALAPVSIEATWVPAMPTLAFACASAATPSGACADGATLAASEASIFAALVAACPNPTLARTSAASAGTATCFGAAFAASFTCTVAGSTSRTIGSELVLSCRPTRASALIAGLLCDWRDAAASATSASTLTGIGCAYFAASACRSRRD